MKKSPANELTQKIIIFFFNYEPRCFAWRENQIAIPIHREGAIVGFRPPSTVGAPDIFVVCPLCKRGVLIGIEVKIGRDRLRDSQIAFHNNLSHVFVPVLVVKSFEDFLNQWENLKLYD